MYVEIVKEASMPRLVTLTSRGWRGSGWIGYYIYLTDAHVLW